MRRCEVIFFPVFLFPLLVCVCSADFCLFLNEPSLLLRPPFFFALQSVFGRLVVKCRKDNKSKLAPTNILSSSQANSLHTSRTHTFGFSEPVGTNRYLKINAP